MPKAQRPQLRLHRETLRRLGAPAPGRVATDPVAQPGDTAFCGPSRLSLCDGGCETA
ncbi:MAG TPA: hypothetical protein VF615_10365 [Longimicrobiaceae bacterium]|jgi:hypothetical protein